MSQLDGNKESKRDQATSSNLQVRVAAGRTVVGGRRIAVARLTARGPDWVCRITLGENARLSDLLLKP